MPVPQGDITSSQIWATPAVEPQLEEVELPEEEVEEVKEEE